MYILRILSAVSLGAMYVTSEIQSNQNYRADYGGASQVDSE